MARYYTVCETTPGEKFWRRSSWYRIYKAYAGYLFCDTENTLRVEDIQKALWQLSKLYEEGPKSVVCVRTTPGTIMATFSTAALPRPAKMERRFAADEGGDYLSATRLTGWLFEDITNPAKSAQYVDYNNLYDDCIMLERLTGLCPCPKLAEGTCFSGTVHKHVPWLAEGEKVYQAPDTGVYKTAAYRNLYGFEYVSGQYTINADFTDSVRPWNNYDFGLVELRKAEFKQRGEESSKRMLLRKVECSRCLFSLKQHTGVIKDCGRADKCTAHSTEEQIWKLLYGWLERTPYKRGSAGFSLAEIEYLITMSGKEYPSKGLTGNRAVDTHLAGFYYSGKEIFVSPTPDLTYKIVAARGDVSRRRGYDSYAALRRDYPQLKPTEELQAGQLSDKIILAHAVLSTWHFVRAEAGHQPHDVHRLQSDTYGVELYGCTSRSTFLVRSLSTVSSAEDYYKALWPYSYHEAQDKIKLLDYVSRITEQSPDTPQPPTQEPHPA